MKLALFQCTMRDDMNLNLTLALEGIKEAAALGADLILYPELTLNKFFPQYEKLSVESAVVRPESKNIRAFQNACRESGIFAAPNFYYEENGKCYDATFIIDTHGEIVGIQKMVHIAQAKQFYEQDYYCSSDDGFKVFNTPFGSIGVVVCFDRHYPESVRTEALMGADLILIPTANTSAEPLDMFRWEVAVQAFQNCTAIAMCNRVGLEGDMDFAGQSLVVDADGNLITMADHTPQLIIADIDLSYSKKAKENRPYTNLRRPEIYI